MGRRPPVTRLLVAAVGLALVGAACSEPGSGSGRSDASADPTSTRVASSSPGGDGRLSVVVIGDSVAAGEGMAYGYTYTYDAADPDRSSWTGGTDDPRWQGRYQLCHQDDHAYGEVVADALDADLAKFACTGATYLNGITAPQTSDDTTYRPAQFGDWDTGTDLNAAYDRARPDVVVLTFGADDVQFSSIVRYCVSGYTAAESAAVEALAAAADPVGAIASALGARASRIAAEITAGATTRRDDVTSSYCTATNPGAPIEQLFWKPVRSGELAEHYRAMVAAIQARGRDPRHGNGKVPRIVITTYPRPLPAGLDGTCWDVYPLAADEQAYLQSLQDTLQATLTQAVAGLDGVTVADLSPAVDGHAWCSQDPWVYGLSTIWFDDVDSQAPFHPTPAGQRAIAGIVGAAIRSATSPSGR